jgi:uncharacterized protein
MPMNVGFEYVNAEQEYNEAKTTAEKVKALKKMLSMIPKHKGTEKQQAQIKKQIKKLQEQVEFEKKQGKGAKSFTIKKEGAGQVAIFGKTNTGKSTLLKMLSGKNVKIADYEYTTSEPVHKMITFENVKIQGIEIPGIYNGFYDSKNGRQFLSVVRNADVVIVLADSKADFDMIAAELEKASIILTKTRERPEGFEVRIPYIKLSKNKFSIDLIPKLWKKMNKIRVQTKTDGKIAPNPIVLPKSSTVEDVARMIHQDFVRKFRYAKIEGPSAKFKGQQVGLEHKCKDRDIVEVFVK